MESRDKLHDYITIAYNRWVDYAAHYVRRSKLPIDPSEVVNDILCALLERDAGKLECLMNRRGDNGTELDFFVMRIIKTSIYSTRSPFRYQRGQHCTSRIRDTMQMADEPSDPCEEDVIALVQRLLPELNVSELSKRVFAWKFLDGNPISKWPGTETQRVLYRAYNCALKKISLHLRRKIAR